MAVFEQPLNERIRTFMRLQQLFSRLEHHLQRGAHWDIHAAVNVLLDIYDLTVRSDLKSEVMKELDRQNGALRNYAGATDIDSKQLDELMNRQSELIHLLHEHRGQISQHIKSNEFLNAVRQRAAVSGIACTHDLPLYHHWLDRPSAECKQTIEGWLSPYQPLQAAVNLSLEAIRESANFRRLHAERGFFQESLTTPRPLQLVRVQTINQPDLYPEISAGRHRITIRFIRHQSANEKPTQSLDDIDFEIAYCAI
jgi:cell division protein ZapD